MATRGPSMASSRRLTRTMRSRAQPPHHALAACCAEPRARPCHYAVGHPGLAASLAAAGPSETAHL
eukprot:10552107-Lingulodinium_polyedra.AAC.1